MKHRLRTLATGITFGEGPRWHNGRLWFSDFYAHRVCSADLAGDLRVELELDGQPSGLGWMPDGSLLVVRMEMRQVWRRWPDGRFECHADLAGHSAFLCNDMVVDAEGRAYVGNFGFDLGAALAERGAAGVLADCPTTVLALVQPDGAVSDAAPGERFAFPNGTVITPDGKTLIVAETFGMRLSQFAVGPDGTLSGRRLFAATAPRLPDGICLDAEGAVWIANPAAPECARIAAGGAVLDTVETGGLNCYACMLGGPTGRHLFMLVAADSAPTASPTGKVLVTEVPVPRAGWP
ncbi:sugar lactone lactonase YvrE [Novosphingobium kunmingense]|uniref:Sugar lactone lactonase YvrE n=1 Tax=Novosphingobium kunmingense TaxID=1211806 RepID=A0A2N0HJI1_9SPHN|nr:SMP-30/gluconolactonase/LRE family protein [Novosphingobium kunmingense]PKB19099.1 sugar lactone lactonase YvrE [Novosphingobium kunmingense]